MHGGNGTDRLRGYDGNDRLYGEGGLDYLYGGDDNDFLNGGLDGQNDVIRGQQGQDEFVQYVWYNVLTRDYYNTESDNFTDFGSGDTVRQQLGMIATIGYLVI